MPQLDVTTFSSQLFWLVICFASLYIFTARVTVPRMTAIFEARRQRIESAMNRADELKVQAEQVRLEFEAILAKARTQAHESVMQMIHKVTVTSAQRKKDLNALMIARIQSSEAHIARQKVQALDEVKTVAQTAAIEAVEKLLAKKVDAKSAGDIVNQLFNQKVA